MHINHPIPIQPISYLSFNEVDAFFIRFDAIDVHISGNKWFKLHQYINDFFNSRKEVIVTFGGAFSNHILATAAYCNQKKIPCIGIIRGEEPSNKSYTLLQAATLGMQLIFVSRTAFSNKQIVLDELGIQNGYIINEGGFGTLGAIGVEAMYNYIPLNIFTHIICACGTGTTMAGLINGARNECIEGVVVLKGYENINEHIVSLLKQPNNNYYHFHHQFSQGGYAKYNMALINCMNELYVKDNIATDFVYTGKMVYAIKQLIEHDYFKKGSNILLIHSGGLQGNTGLPKQLLYF